MISIITINFNNKLGLIQTIESVTNQIDANVEYIVIDGNSSDGSKEIIADFDDQIDYWVSEPDSGIYAAMNKGIKAAKGEYLLFLNSGDSLYSLTILRDVTGHLKGGKDIYFGNLWLLAQGKERIFEYPSELTLSWVYRNSLPHPATFIKKELFENNLYNEDLKLVSDWQFFMNAIFKGNVNYEHLTSIISNFDTGGFSNDPKYRIQMEEERALVMKADFPSLYKDVLELETLRKQLDRADVKLLLDSKMSKTGRRIHLKVLKLLSKLFPFRLLRGTQSKERKI